MNRAGLELDYRLFRNLSEDRTLKREVRKWCAMVSERARKLLEKET